MKLTIALAAAAALAAPAIALATSAPAASAHPAAAVPVCGTSLETWFAPDGDGFSGHIAYVVEFSNIGKTTCTVTGFPTVKLTKNGHQVGLKASHFGGAPATVTLKSGQTAHVVLIITNAGVVCSPVPTNGLLVRQPGQTQAQIFGLASAACPGKSTMIVDAINPGTGIPHFTIR